MNKLLEKLKSTLLQNGTSKEKVETIIQSILYCKTQKDLRDNYWKTYLHLKRFKGWEITQQILTKTDRKSYSDQEVIDSCNLASSLSELRTKYVNFYVIAVNRKLQDKISVFKNKRQDSHTSSIGEETIRMFLEQIFEKDFEKCRPDFLLGSKGRKLELDGYCEKLNIAFEHNGAHHYRDTGRSCLEEIKNRDSIKEKKCIENGVKLIVIPDIVEYFMLDENKIKKHILNEFNRLNIDIPHLFYVTPLTITSPDSSSWSQESILLELLKHNSYSNFKHNRSAFNSFNRLGFREKIENHFSPNSLISSEELILSILGNLSLSLDFIKKNKLKNKKILLDFKTRNYSDNFVFIQESLHKGEFFDNLNKRVKISTVNEFIENGEIPVFNYLGIRLESVISINKRELDEDLMDLDIFKNISFSKAEKRVLFLIKKCNSNLEIAQILGISEKAVKYQLSSIFKKTNLKNKQELLSKIIPKNYKIREEKITGLGLTTKEKEIIISLKPILSNRDLAKIHNVSEKTIKFHFSSIFKKINCKNKAELFSYLIG